MQLRDRHRSMRRLVALALLGVFALLHGASPGIAQDSRIAHLSEEEIAQGERIYKAQCALCHGIDGAGGTGPSLQRPVLTRARDDAALFSIVQRGVPGRMPGSWLSENETWRVAGYVQALGKVETGDITGDVRRGEQVYKAKGCAGCHIISGEGGSLGPDLTTIGDTRGPHHLRASLVEPGAALPEGLLLITAVTTDGGKIRGLRVNEDVFTIQLRDAANRFHSLRKTNLRELRREFGKTLMPSYQDSLAPRELDDLIAYLASLRRGE